MRGPLPRDHGWNDEHRRVIPACQRMETRNTIEIRLFSLPDREVVRVTDLVGPVTTTPRIAEIAGHARGERFAALRACNTSNLPPADDCVSNAPQITQEMPSPANWQLVDVAHHETVPEIRQYRAILSLRVVCILDGRAHVTIGVPQIVGQRIRGEEVKSV